MPSGAPHLGQALDLTRKYKTRLKRLQGANISAYCGGANVINFYGHNLQVIVLS
jgi:hypothetical protein